MTTMFFPLGWAAGLGFLCCLMFGELSGLTINGSSKGLWRGRLQRTPRTWRGRLFWLRGLTFIFLCRCCFLWRLLRTIRYWGGSFHSSQKEKGSVFLTDPYSL